MSDSDEHYRLAFEQAQRDLATQESVLEALRTRATTVLAAGSVTLGVTATGHRWAVVLAGAVYAVLGVLVAAILWPRDWRFPQAVDLIILRGDEAEPPPIGRTYRGWAIWLQEDRHDNREQLEHLTALFRVACALLVAEVLLALLRLG